MKDGLSVSWGRASLGWFCLFVAGLLVGRLVEGIKGGFVCG